MSFLITVQDCWSRGFNHAEYLRFIEAISKRGHTHPHVVSEAVYIMISAALDLDMEQNIGTDRPVDIDDAECVLDMSHFKLPINN